MIQRNDELISVQQAAKYFGVQMQSIYKAIYRKKLKIVKQMEMDTRGYIRPRTYTTRKWLDEYKVTQNQKTHIRQNGKLVFRPDQGTFSSSQAEKYLGLTKNQLSHYRITGKIKFVKVGYYYRYEKEDLDLLRQSIEEKEQLLKTG